MCSTTPGQHHSRVGVVCSSQVAVLKHGLHAICCWPVCLREAPQVFVFSCLCMEGRPVLCMDVCKCSWPSGVQECWAVPAGSIGASIRQRGGRQEPAHTVNHHCNPSNPITRYCLSARARTVHQGHRAVLALQLLASCPAKTPSETC